MAALLARREKDGLSLRALSKETGIPFGTLSWWSWRLRHDSQGAAPAGGFVELVATGHGESLGADLVVALGNGVELRVGRGVDVAFLREIVGVLRTC